MKIFSLCDCTRTLSIVISYSTASTIVGQLHVGFGFAVGLTDEGLGILGGVASISTILEPYSLKLPTASFALTLISWVPSDKLFAIKLFPVWRPFAIPSRIISYKTASWTWFHVHSGFLLLVGLKVVGTGIDGGVVSIVTICEPYNEVLPAKSIALTLISCVPSFKVEDVK